MKLLSTLLYVPDVAASVRFYGEAFGLSPSFATEDGAYAQMETGEASLAFAAETAAGDLGLPMGRTRPDGEAPSVQIAFETDDPAAVVARVLAAGGSVVNPPTQRPWGQTIAHVRDRDGFIVEVGTPQAQEWHD